MSPKDDAHTQAEAQASGLHIYINKKYETREGGVASISTIESGLDTQTGKVSRRCIGLIEGDNRVFVWDGNGRSCWNDKYDLVREHIPSAPKSLAETAKAREARIVELEAALAEAQKARDEASERAETYRKSSAKLGGIQVREYDDCGHPVAGRCVQAMVKKWVMQ